MKTLIYGAVLNFVGLSASASESRFRAGAATSNITPEIGRPVIGFGFGEKRE